MIPQGGCSSHKNRLNPTVTTVALPRPSPFPLRPRAFAFLAFYLARQRQHATRSNRRDHPPHPCPLLVCLLHKPTKMIFLGTLTSTFEIHLCTGWPRMVPHLKSFTTDRNSSSLMKMILTRRFGRRSVDRAEHRRRIGRALVLLPPGRTMISLVHLLLPPTIAASWSPPMVLLAAMFVH